jgi:hypothetical protein
MPEARIVYGTTGPGRLNKERINPYALGIYQEDKIKFNQYGPYCPAITQPVGAIGKPANGAWAYTELCPDCGVTDCELIKRAPEDANLQLNRAKILGLLSSRPTGVNTNR